MNRVWLEVKRRRGGFTLIELLVVIAIGFAAWTMLNPNEDVKGRPMGSVIVDFKALKLSARSNKFLVLPEGFEGGARPDMRSPVFPVPPAALAKRAKEILQKQDRTDLVRDVDANHQLELVQRSAILRFPDYVTLQALPVGEGKSALAIYSRSKYGRSDFGVNGKRIRAWLDLIVKTIGKAD